MLWIGVRHCPETAFLDCFGAQESITKESIPPAYLKGLSHEIDFKNIDKNVQNLA